MEKVQIGPFGSQLHVSDYISDGIPLINPMHIHDLTIKEDYNYSINKKKYDSLPNYHLAQNDIIMARRGEMGRCAKITFKEIGWLCGTGSLFIRPKASINSTFLLYLLSGE